MCFSNKIIRARNSLIVHLLLRSSLILSFHSNQMSHCEQIAQVAQRQWTTVSESLRSLRGNEHPWANHTGSSEEMSEWEIHLKHFGYKNLKSCFYLVSFIYDKKKKILKKEWIAHFRSFPLFWWAIRSRSLISSEQYERIAQVAHQKWANEWIDHFFERIAHSLIFRQKTSNLLGKLMSEVPALKIIGAVWPSEEWC